jgi:hypothetical protein
MMDAGYYLYLLRISWPALSGLFVITIFLVRRSYRSWQRARRERTISSTIKLTLRIFLTAVVFAIYTNMFINFYGDWLQRPLTSKGIVESIQKDPNSPNYVLTLRNGEEKVAILVDRTIKQNIQEKDLVEIAYLSQKNQAYRCTLLTR